jgi:hypothetical protein
MTNSNIITTIGSDPIIKVTEKPKEIVVKKLQSSNIYSNHLVLPKSWLNALGIEEQVRLEFYEDRIELKKEEISHKS